MSDISSAGIGAGSGAYGRTCRQDVLRRVDVPVVPGATGRALPRPGTEAQRREQVPARRARLRCGVGPALVRRPHSRGRRSAPAAATRWPTTATAGRTGPPDQAAQDRSGPPASQDHLLLAQQERLPDAGAGGGHADHVRVVAGDALRRPAVAVNEPAVLVDVLRHGVSPGAVRVDPGVALEDDVGAAPPVALQVQRNVRIGLEALVLRPVLGAVDQELPVLPQKPDRGGLWLPGRVTVVSQIIGSDCRRPAAAA